MKKRAKVFLLIIFCLLSTGMFGCGNYTGKIDKEIKTVENNYVSDENKEKLTEKPESVKVEEKIILEQNDIIIKSTGIEDGVFGTDLKILIENNSNKNLTFQTKNSSINGFMSDTIFSEDVAAGKKSNTSITFKSNGLENFGMDMFAKMEFSFHVFCSDNWDTYFDSDIINIETSIAKTYEQKIDDSGDILYENDGIKIVAKGLSFDNSYMGPGLVLYIENNSDNDFTVQVRDVSVNGFMVNTIMSQNVIKGKKAINSVTFLNSSLEENSITEIENIEISFNIFETDNWKDIVDTEPIIINF